ncbi:hypothetical protein KKA15_03030 [Patescibacteria group bacterium]|nr:hypothetical protein [Patescibacteria group bacterium]
MKIKTTIFLLLMLIVATFIFHTFFLDNFNTSVRYINDYWVDFDHDGQALLVHHDKGVYALRGVWFPRKLRPYTDVFSEYPEIATYFFAIPYFFINTTDDATILFEYSLVFSLLMMIFLAFTISLLYKMKPEKKYLAFLMLLPASLYFSYNRYDIIIAFIMLLSLFYLREKKFGLATLILAIGVMTKWFLIILFPIYLTYYYWQKEKNHTTPNAIIHSIKLMLYKINWKMITIFVLTISFIILPTLYFSGLKGFLIPYDFHMSRGVNDQSFLFQITFLLDMLSDQFKTIGSIIHSLNIRTLLYGVFFVMQFFISLLVITSRIDSFEKVIKWSLLSILFFVLFAKFYSPQWILWFSPLLIYLAKNKKDVFLIVILDLITYLYFPVVYDIYKHSIELVLICSLISIILIILIFRTFPQLIKDNHLLFPKNKKQPSSFY